jgi:hypothetical protein
VVVRRLLVRRTVSVRWSGTERHAAYPINILESAKGGLPNVLGARPDEQQLLAYFHGRIGEDDLLAILEQRARQLADGVGMGITEGPPADLQNYLIRDFVEGLFGLEDTLKAALYAPRALETALLGEFSPVALADHILTAFAEKRRSATAAAFQFAELLRVVVGLPVGTSEADHKALEEVVQRAANRLLTKVVKAAREPSFSTTLRNKHFISYVEASLPRGLAAQFLANQEASDDTAS